MSQSTLVAGLAVRELWITFRLLAMLAAFVGAGAAVVLVPAGPGTALERLAVGFGAATLVCAALSAWSLAAERTSGRAAWLVTRSVSRGTVLLGWFIAVVGIGLVATGSGAVLGWLAVAARISDPTELGAALGAVTAGVVASVALALLAGTLLRPARAATAVAAVFTLVGAAALLPPTARLVPYALLTAVPAPGSVLADALRAAGLALTVAALLLVVARIAIERAEL